MVRNNKLLETLFRCTKDNTTLEACRGCFYGDGSDSPHCIFTLMNDILFFFGNPVPSPNAHIIPIEELEEILSDRKDHLAFAEFINTIHVAKPVIRTVTSSGNFINFLDPQTNETESFNKSDYYARFRVWSTKPTDKLRNDTPWIPIDGQRYTEDDPTPTTKTQNILNYIQNATKKD